MAGKRVNTVSIKLTDEEKQMLLEKAIKAGVSMSDYVRLLVLYDTKLEREGVV